MNNYLLDPKADEILQKFLSYDQSISREEREERLRRAIDQSPLMRALAAYLLIKLNPDSDIHNHETE